MTINNRKFVFSNLTLIHSNNNSVGKTTLVRLILYGMGYAIPSTRGLNFDKLNVKLTLIDEKKEKMLFCRSNGNLNIIYNGEKLKFYKKDLSLKSAVQSENNRLKVLTILYEGITEPHILFNMLGLHYFDQEKGWTLLNRGNVIGKIHFRIESLLEGLTSINIEERKQKIEKLKVEQETYKQLKTVLSWRDKFDTDSGDINWEKNDNIQNDLKSINFEIAKRESEINRLKSIKSKNKDLLEYILGFRLRIKSKSGEKFILKKENIDGFDENQRLIDAKISIEKRELEKLKLNRNAKMDQFNAQISIVENKKRISQFVKTVYNLKLNTEKIDEIEKDIKSELRKEKIILKKLLSSNNIAIRVYNRFYKYSELLGISESIGKEPNFLFNSELKKYSGAELHLMNFGFKLALLKEVQERFKITIPIIIDSPRSGELTSKNFGKMIKLLEKEFLSNQIIVASIYRPDWKDYRQINIETSLLNSGEEMKFEFNSDQI